MADLGGRRGGRSWDVHPSWLRDHCQCAQCVDPVSQQKLHSSGSFWPPPSVHKVERTDQTLRVDWGSPHGWSTYSVEDLHAATPELEISTSAADHIAGQADGAMALAARRAAVPFVERPRIEFAALQQRPGARAWALRTMHGSGLCMVQRVPPMVAGQPGVTAVAELLAPVMHTFYGRHWDVRFEEGAQNLAYSALELDWHQDLLYFESPPGLQLLHCLAQARQGGATLFLDAVAAAESFRAAAPAAHARLARAWLPYHYRAMGVAMEQRRPVFEGARSPDAHRSVWWSPHWLAPMDAPSADASLYESLHQFQLHLRAQPRLALRLEPGDTIVFDNRRMLHARDAFSGGSRHLQGCYIAQDTFRVALLSDETRAVPFTPSVEFQ